MNNLIRKPGLTRTSNLHLDHRSHRPSVADVNGYYRILGLTDGRGVLNVSRAQIARAYRRLMREVRTSTGEILDYRSYEMVGCAWNCLGNRESRAEYDRLRPPSLWIDHLVLREARRAAARVRLEGGAELARRVGGAPSAGGERRFAYYVEPGLDVEYAFASDWMDNIARALHALGRDQDVRVGFTADAIWRLDRQPWGDIFVLPESWEPSFSQAAYVVSQVVGQPHWTHAYMRIVAGRLS